MWKNMENRRLLHKWEGWALFGKVIVAKWEFFIGDSGIS